ncbi:hypothetical protein C0993_009112 [Termitomyces sp. T159_Od127]|nr:hypothetical protein C0993_009112 [Termitomyces sp. T159_Od127]
MVRAMDATCPGPLSLQQHQTRARSSSDASHLSSAISDAYSDLHEGRIGEDFTLVKMQPLTTFAGSMQTNTSSGRSHNRSENTLSVRKDLPEWLRSTFSSLSEKHPLRLLLPNKCPQTDTNDHRSNDFKTDLAFACGIDRVTQTMPNYLQAVDHIGPNNDRHHAFCTVPPSTPDVYSLNAKDNVQKLQSFSATCGDHVFLTLNPVSSSTPKLNPGSMHQLPATFEMKELNELDPNPATEYKSLAFIPFSTPGPASTLGSCVAANSLPSLSKSHTNCPVDTDIETSACFPRHIATTFPISHSRHTSAGSSAIDSCLPPYRAAASDPAPAYSSDGMYHNAYNADPSRDESDSEPRGLTDDFTNVLATPCAPRPLFFDSPTEEPSDQNNSQPGFEIDLDAIDFKWTPFNRKLVEEKKLSLGDQRGSISRNNLIPGYSETGVNCTVISQAGSPEATLMPESLPSPSPFRFTPQQLKTNTNSTFNYVEPQTTQTTKLSQPFAPAPGIYVSPLRDKMEAQTSVPVRVFVAVRLYV